jgi:pimeloyl-ACP methyl ester carboxylesterase
VSDRSTRWLIGVALVAGMSLAAAPTAAGSPAPSLPPPPQDLLPQMPDGGHPATVKLDGVDIYYTTYGEGDPVILLHGGLANGDYFANQVPALAKDHQVIVMDSRGHGRSSFDDVPISYDLMAADVLALMDHLSLPKASIVGWSDGGNIALDIAINHPDRLDKVVAYGANFDPTGVRLDVGTNPLFTSYINRAAEDYARLSPDPSRFAEFLNNIGTMWATEPNFTEDQLRAISTPFLILDGAKEEAVDLNQTKLMAELIPGAKLELMPDTGHFGMLEQPDEVNRIVTDFLAGS